MDNLNNDSYSAKNLSSNYKNSRLETFNMFIKV